MAIKQLNKDFCLLIGLVVLAVTVVIKIGWVFLSDPNHFPLSVIKVSAPYNRVEQAEIEKVITPYTQASFFSLNSKVLIEKLKSIPWIEKVSVSRKWPDTLTIMIKEHEPIALWNGKYLLTSRGESFSPPSETIPNDLPKLEGPDSDAKEVLQVYRKLSNIIPKDELIVEKLVKSKSHSWSLYLVGDTEIRLGTIDPLNKLKRFGDLYPGVFRDKIENVAMVDLRYPHGFAVRWKNQLENRKLR